MKDAGIDITTFKPHSTRAASTSKAKAVAVPIQKIQNTAGWSLTRCQKQHWSENTGLLKYLSKQIL